MYYNIKEFFKKLFNPCLRNKHDFRLSKTFPTGHWFFEEQYLVCKKCGYKEFYRSKINDD